MARRKSLSLERVECRLTPAGFGNTWVDTNLTVSIVPDGTNVGGSPSQLNSLLNSTMTFDSWNRTIQQAFQTWIAPANLNVAFVSDDGQPIGAPGPVQGAPNVGDIRISARPLSSNVLAISNPFDLISEAAGEIILNSNVKFDNDGSLGPYDLRTVLLHEIGHALGLPASTTDLSSVMTEYNGLPKYALSDTDVASIQGLYGVREADGYEGSKGNDAINSASPLVYLASASQLASTSDVQSLIAFGDLTTSKDIDVYKVMVPTDAVSPTVVVSTKGISQSRLRVTLLTGTKTPKIIGSSSTPNANGEIVLPFSEAALHEDLFVKVEAAYFAGNAAIGGYQLVVGNDLKSIPSVPATTLIETPTRLATDADWLHDTATNDSLSTATSLGQSRTSTDQRWDFSGTATFGHPTDIDYYSFRATTDQSTLLAYVDSSDGVFPEVRVLNSSGNEVPFTVLLKTSSTMIVQVEAVPSSKATVIEVRRASGPGVIGAPAYNLGIDLRDQAVAVETFATGTLTASASTVSGQVDVTTTQLLRVQLSATSATSNNEYVTGSVYDANGVVVFSLTAMAGQTCVGDIYLEPGTYTFSISGMTTDSTSLGELAFSASVVVLTDPIGLTDPVSRTDSSTETTAKSWWYPDYSSLYFGWFL